MNFLLHVRDNWHEGVALAVGYVVVAGWRALGLPTGVPMILEAGRVAGLWMTAMYFGAS